MSMVNRACEDRRRGKRSRGKLRYGFKGVDHALVFPAALPYTNVREEKGVAFPLLQQQMCTMCVSVRGLGLAGKLDSTRDNTRFTGVAASFSRSSEKCEMLGTN